METISFEQEVYNERFYQTAIPNLQNFENFGNLEKNNQQKILISKNKIFLEFGKTDISVKETCQVYMCTKFHVDILKNDRVLAF